MNSALASLVFLAALAAGAAAAPTSNSDLFSGNEEIVVTADKAVGYQNERKTVWSGSVRVAQGDAVLTAKEVTANFDDNGAIVRVSATGGVRYTRGEDIISGASALFDNAARTLTISGDVVATQGRQVITGGTLVYNIDSGRAELSPAQSGRVHGVFQPNSGSGRS